MGVTVAIRRTWHWLVLVAIAALAAPAAISRPTGQGTASSQKDARELDGHQRSDTFDDRIAGHAADLLKRGRHIFRFDTFGDERFWGGTLRLHEAVEGARSVASEPDSRPPRRSGGLKVDAEALSSATLTRSVRDAST